MDNPSEVARRADLVSNIYQAADTLAQLTHLTNGEAMHILDLIIKRDQEGLRFEFFRKALERPGAELLKKTR